MLEGLLLQMPLTLLGVVLVLFVLYLLSSTPGEVNAPPGPRPLPLLGNLFHLDLKQLDVSLCELSKKYGYKTVKQALVNYAEEFGDRDIPPIFRDTLKGHGVAFANGNSWKEMRRFTLSNLREFGMGQWGGARRSWRNRATSSRCWTILRASLLTPLCQ
ncbi:hypothetical protein SKAU_G00116400 [Synaphobranchus kaupii]|uniref:Uncharacterized protein n=1 Tax=Synaphobranchus kaupii TaxID=118154 RepID=A0A9Q1J101_SYNKA|nr:hypothetical protein SKAU_G00116400 [Synaphobranchus kaupii]